MAARSYGGTYSHVAVVGGAWGWKMGAAAAAAAAAARYRGATPMGGAVTPHAQRSCARPRRRTSGRLRLTAKPRGASNRVSRWRQQPPTRRCSRSWRVGSITRGSSWALRNPEDAARGRRAQLGAAGAVRAL